MFDLAQRLPTEEEKANAAAVVVELSRARDKSGALTILDEHGVRLTPALAEKIVELLTIIARGDMVTLVPTGALLTTQQAADMLNISRPYLSKLLKGGVIPFVKVGSHRRVKFEDLMAYKVERDAMRDDGLRELQRLGQEADAA